MVWGALVMLLVFGLLKVFLAVVVFAKIRDDQLHEVNGVPGGLWLLFCAVAAGAALDAVLGVFIFRAARWAWVTAVAAVAASIALGLAAAVMSASISLTGIVPDLAVLGVVLNRDVRHWCSRPA